MCLGRLQPSVHLPRADLEQLLLHFPPQAKAFADPRHPPGQQCFQSHRPGTARRFSYRRQHRQGLLAIASSHVAVELCVASPAAVGSAIGSHISGVIPCWRKIRSRLLSWPFVPPSGSAHKLPADTPIALGFPTGPPAKRTLFSWVTSMARRCRLRLHSSAGHPVGVVMRP